MQTASGLFIICCNLFICSTVAFHQNDYTIKHHRMELVSYNHSYISNIKTSLVPLNRTVRAINSTFELLVDLTNKIPLSLQAFKFSMNDYRPFPFFLNSEYCKMRRENLFGINDIEMHSNLPPCPLKKGKYYINKYRPDESKFPPHLHPGDFKVVLKFHYDSDVMSEIHWYGSVNSAEKSWK